jgi:hypothetical protein
MVRWVVTSNPALLDELKLIPFEERKTNPRIVELVRSLKTTWSKGTKIERLATLGWNEYEVCQLFSELLENLPRLRAEYEQQVKAYGKPPDLDDKDLDKFDNAIKEASKAMRK